MKTETLYAVWRPGSNHCEIGKFTPVPGHQGGETWTVIATVRAEGLARALVAEVNLDRENKLAAEC